MSAGAHTPGPWHMCRPFGPALGFPVETDDGPIAAVHGGDRGDANARLIAAAPDLLAALRDFDLTCSTDHLNPCWDGRPSDIPGKHWGGGKACPECRARAALAKAEAS